MLSTEQLTVENAMNIVVVEGFEVPIFVRFDPGVQGNIVRVNEGLIAGDQKNIAKRVVRYR